MNFSFDGTEIYMIKVQVIMKRTLSGGIKRMEPLQDELLASIIGEKCLQLFVLREASLLTAYGALEPFQESP
jgi:hypothetical protein